MAIRVAIMPTVKYNFLAMDTFLNHVNTGTPFMSGIFGYATNEGPVVLRCKYNIHNFVNLFTT
jgi:hypothetical protein